MFGLTQEQIDFLKKNLVNPLSNIGTKVYVFGSRARGSHNTYSDLDLLIEGSSKKTALLLAEAREFFEQSNFPYKIDFVLENELIEAYRKKVLKDRILLE